VRDIRLNPKNVEQVQVLMEVSVDTPIKQDTVAELALQGITGVAFIQLTGGTHAAAKLSATGGTIPVITSKQSVLQEVLGKLPQVVEKAVLVADRIGELFDKKNLDSISASLANVQNFTGSLGSNTGDLQLLLRDGRNAANVLQGAATDIKAAAGAIRALSVKLGTQIDPLVADTGKTMSNFRQNMASLGRAAETVNKIAQSAQGLLEDNKGSIRDFSQSGLYEFSQFIAEARVLVDSLTRLTNRIERDPTHFLFGDSQKGVRAQ
jgi:phospholipid/cholesterol/gamma-HCH transport system substrate-binding protein